MEESFKQSLGDPHAVTSVNQNVEFYEMKLFLFDTLIVINLFMLETALALKRSTRDVEKSNNINAITDWLNDYNEGRRNRLHIAKLALWDQYTNLESKEARRLYKEAEQAINIYKATKTIEAKNFDLSGVKDAMVLRQFKTILDSKSVQADDLTSIITQLAANFSTITVCARDADGIENCSLQWSLEPHLRNVMATSQEPDELLYAWNQWHTKTGRTLRKSFIEYVRLNNEAARKSNFSDVGDFWRSKFETPDIEKQMEAVVHQILPLYEQLHAYVRRRLAKHYGRHHMNSSTIPAHFLGGMFATQWQSIFNITKPYDDVDSVDVTKAMIEQNYSAMTMVKKAEDFFVSLGFENMTEAFWTNSQFVKPTDGRKTHCNPSAWDMYDGNDYRILACASVDAHHLYAIHHEMGHIVYFMQYANQPYLFRDGANPAFHEAIGDTIEISFNTPEHLRKIGLMPQATSLDAEQDKKQEINALYRAALKQIAFIMPSYQMAYWRWKVFDGSYPVENWNREWWNTKFQFQGLTPPVARDDGLDMDFLSIYHVVNDIPCMQYFASIIIQFQFYHALCTVAHHNIPLHKCDFYGSTETGELLKRVLKLGSSVPWQQAMAIMTGHENMSAEPMVKYFQPLMDWLKADNEAHNECYGWGFQWPEEVARNLASPRCA